ncbi:hypothetical protein IMG5_161330 [Ichthyophthirius multifiliis]|uniref:Tetratricopeptide repeat protein n=1 Tax=Ichthyophthirius multifiliis TaxID=5932 RepID=G0R025_ICHMU|nr:hypothetical protein IMG5_161330 [Ichthyophthirius multifiliis]EGR29183.1 hypothetical protein IMG5_161330 [Ichthyophthirius multifiliis]|eukprot:XP_004030419.1 hypothetical protein IMG5_161330 [Ichthyophthirius multifiliis]
MHQLALAKILVFTHEKSQFLLVEAHTKLGIAYLDFKCYEQAIDHLTTALKKNGTLFSEIKESKLYHSTILTYLGKCYLYIQSYDDSLELLIKANEIQVQINGENDVSCIQTLTYISNCYSKLKDYDRALEYLKRILNISESKYGYKSEQSAVAYIDIAKIYELQNSIIEAIEFQQKAIEILEEIDYINVKIEFLAEQYQVLSKYQEKANKIDQQLYSLQKIIELYQEIYGSNDKKIMKIKKQISSIHLKNQNHEEALDILEEIEEIESKTHGENSIQVAKILRLIGTIKILTKNYFDAQKCLCKSMKIFDENGMKKFVIEIKEKLKLAKDMKDKKGVLKQNTEDY